MVAMENFVIANVITNIWLCNEIIFVFTFPHSRDPESIILVVAWKQISTEQSRKSIGNLIKMETARQLQKKK